MSLEAEVALGPEVVIVLDIDDTMYLERDYVRSGFTAVGAQVAERLGVHGVSETLWAGFEAGVRGDAFNRALRAHDIEDSPQLIGDLIEHYRSHLPDIKLLPDAGRLVERLSHRAVAGITDGPAVSQRNKVKALGLDSVLEPLVVTAELGPGRSKPNPMGYQLVEDQLDVARTSCCYVADNPAKDFISPLERGWVSVRIRREDSLHQDVATPEGVAEIDSLDQLLLR